MQLKNSRKRPDTAGVYFTALLLSASVLFFQCKEESQEQPKGKFSLAAFFTELKQLDSTSDMLRFDSGARSKLSSEYLLMPHNPPHVPGLSSNTRWLKETENTETGNGQYKVDFTTEYWLQDGRVVKLTRTDTMGPHTKTVQYDASGLPAKIVSYYPDNKDSVTETFSYNPDKTLSKIVSRDSKSASSLTRSFNYDSTGNLVDMIAKDSDGKTFNDKYYVDDKNISALTIRLDDKQQVLWAAYSIHDSLGVPAYEEQYVKVFSNVTQTKKLYQYSPSGDLERLEVIRPKKDTTVFAFTYPERDSTGRWTKKWTFKGKDVIGITEREMK